MSPEESAAHNLRVFRRVRPGTIFSITFEKDFHQEIMICSKVLDSSTLQTGSLTEAAFEKPLPKEKLTFSDISLINILKEKAVSVNATASWQDINIYDNGRVGPSGHAAMTRNDADDCLDELKQNFDVLDSSINSMNVAGKPGRLFSLTLSADIEEIKSFLASRGWQDFNDIKDLWKRDPNA